MCIVYFICENSTECCFSFAHQEHKAYRPKQVCNNKQICKHWQLNANKIFHCIYLYFHFAFVALLWVVTTNNEEFRIICDDQNIPRL